MAELHPPPADITPWDVIVIGAGAAGLLSAAVAAERSRRTLLLEKNRKVGAKILMSGGTRCNLTHATDAAGIAQAFGKPGRFLRSSLAAFPPDALVHWIHSEGVATKVEETGKVFPASDRAVDVQQALLRRLQRSGAVLKPGEPVVEVARGTDGFHISTATGRYFGRSLIVATGGCSYPGCGTTGDGYAWFEMLGHTIVPPRPALVPLLSPLPWVTELKGITLPDVLVRVVPKDFIQAVSDPTECCAIVKRRHLAERRSSLLLTHFGLSGPAALDVSRVVSQSTSPTSLCLVCDLWPDRHVEQLWSDWTRQASPRGNQTIATRLSEFTHAMPHALPARLVSELLTSAEIPTHQKLAEMSKTDSRRVVGLLKSLVIPLSGTRGFKKAEVTAGGVDLSEVDSSTMQSRLVPGLFPIGEILDLDGPIGGYNFQAAFSTGWLAAQHV